MNPRISESDAAPRTRASAFCSASSTSLWARSLAAFLLATASSSALRELAIESASSRENPAIAGVFSAETFFEADVFFGGESFGLEDVFFGGGAFEGEADFLAATFPATFLVVLLLAFLATAFLATAFLATAFLATAFLATAFLATAFLAGII
ncbi:MAG TPA: hypothetical protein DCS60_07615 [Opitutae bacterium]|nr:hypothetical protein [Opitutae bacterium]